MDFYIELVYLLFAAILPRSNKPRCLFSPPLALLFASPSLRDTGSTPLCELDAIGRSYIGISISISKFGLSKILREVDLESDATISVFEGVLSMILGRLRCCLTACTKIMSRYWQYLFDIYINNEKFVLNALRSNMLRLRQYLKYAESSSTLDPWPVDRRSVGYHDGKNSLGGDPLQNLVCGGLHTYII